MGGLLRETELRQRVVHLLSQVRILVHDLINSVLAKEVETCLGDSSELHQTIMGEFRNPMHRNNFLAVVQKFLKVTNQGIPMEPDYRVHPVSSYR